MYFYDLLVQYQVVKMLSKNVERHGWLTTKKLKKIHWLKRPEAVPKKQNLIFGILFLRILSIQLFYIHPDVAVDIIRVSF